MTNQNDFSGSSATDIHRCISFHVHGEMDDADRVACGWLPAFDLMHEATFMVADSFLWSATSFVPGAATYKAAVLEHRHIGEYPLDPTDPDDQTEYPEAEDWRIPANSWAACSRCLKAQAAALEEKGEDRGWIDHLIGQMRKRPRTRGVPSHVTVGPLEEIRTRRGLPIHR